MSNRSNYILGDDVFIKLVSLDQDQGITLYNSLTNPTILPPFNANEFLFNYLIIGGENKNILTPGTTVLVSSNQYTIEDMEKYQNMSYQGTLDSLDFIDFDNYLKNMTEYSQQNKYIKTALIISKRMTGNYDDFINIHKTGKIFLDSMIHISYLYFKLQSEYKAVHGDPKIHNYTWLEFEEPIDLIYDFRDEYNQNDNMIIRRKNVKHLFYLTDLEFVYSPIAMVENNIFFNFTHNYIASNQSQVIYVPKISSKYPYNYNDNLYGAYNYSISNQNKTNPNGTNQNETLYNVFGGVFPRMYTVDLLVLVKMFLTYSYADSFDGDVLRKLHMHFTRFVSLSFIEENDKRRDSETYYDVSPASLAKLLSS